MNICDPNHGTNVVACTHDLKIFIPWPSSSPTSRRTVFVSKDVHFNLNFMVSTSIATLIISFNDVSTMSEHSGHVDLFSLCFMTKLAEELNAIMCHINVMVMICFVSFWKRVNECNRAKEGLVESFIVSITNN